MPITPMLLPSDEDPIDASSQVAWLRSMGDREALFQIMEGDRRSMQGLDAAEALAQLGDVRGLDHLIAVLNDAHSSLRMEAAEVLERLGHPRGLRALERRQTETPSSHSAAEREEVYEDLNAATTDELMAIWHENDRDGWSDMEYDVIEDILLERLGSLPRRPGDAGHTAEVDAEADERIRQLWQQGDAASLRRVMVQERDASLRFDAAEALADLGDESALNLLIETLEDVDETQRNMAARILDWLDLPRGNAALREGGYEFDSEEDGSVETQEGAASMPAALGEVSAAHEAERSKTESEIREPWTSRSPRMPRGNGPGAGQNSDTGSRSSLGVILTGATGGLLAFLAVAVGLDMLGMRALPRGLSQWVTPGLVYGMIEALVVGAVAGSIGRRAAQALARRDGEDVEEQDARLVLGALISGAIASALASVLRFVFGG